MDKVLDRIATALEQIATCLSVSVQHIPTVTASVDVAPTTEAKPARKAKAKAEVADEAPAVEAEVLPAKTITQAEIADMVRKLVASDPAKGHANATSVLASFGAKRISELKPEHFPATISRIEALLKAK